MLMKSVSSHERAAGSAYSTAKVEPKPAGFGTVTYDQCTHGQVQLIVWVHTHTQTHTNMRHSQAGQAVLHLTEVSDAQSEKCNPKFPSR